MRVKIQDRAAFQALTPRDVRAYLIGQQWQEVGQISTLAAVFTKTDQ
jgi:hypothetical protein